MSQVIAQREVLSLAADDFTGLYELLWRLNTVLPAEPAPVRAHLARDALRHLLLTGLVDLYRRPQAETAEELLSLDAALRAIEERALWDPPRGGEEYVVAATQKGMQLAHPMPPRH